MSIHAAPNKAVKLQTQTWIAAKSSVFMPKQWSSHRGGAIAISMLTTKMLTSEITTCFLLTCFQRRCI